MYQILFALIVCEFSADVLKGMCSKQKNILEEKAAYLSPKEKRKCEQKICISGFFEKFLKYGGIVYAVLAVILKFLQLIIT